MRRGKTNCNEMLRGGGSSKLDAACFSAKLSATHIDIYDKTRKAAFTLAEVLITLGIIGVVAAITIPTLIKNYQKQVWVNQLKSNISILENGFKQMLAVEGVEYLQDTSVYKSIGGSEANSNDKGRGIIKFKKCYYSAPHTSTSENCKDFYANLGKYIKIVKIEDLPNQWLDDKSNWIWHLNYFPTASDNVAHGKSFYGNGPLLYLANGATLQGIRNRSKPVNYLEHGVMSDFAVDVNGIKGPNIHGRDIFQLNVFDNGQIVPHGSKLYSLDTYNSETSGLWTVSDRARNCYTKKEGITSSGFGCAARIIEKGWKMDY